MSVKFSSGALLSAAVLLASFIATPLLAAASEYQFELVKAEPAGPRVTDVTVKLVHIPDNKPVPDAIIFETKADMGPSGMKGMKGQTSLLPASVEPGMYRISAETGMGGTWALALAAKVQGETETVRGTVNFDAN
nr:hypothetical protein DBT45_09645 [Aerococcus tenax]RAW03849.1 hypothetical protein DBT41_10825 [Aerococcus urinae]